MKFPFLPNIFLTVTLISIMGTSDSVKAQTIQQSQQTNSVKQTGGIGLSPGRYLCLDTPSMAPQNMFVDANGRISWQALPEQLLQGQYVYLGTDTQPVSQPFTINWEFESNPRLANRRKIPSKGAALLDGRYVYLGNPTDGSSQHTQPQEFAVNNEQLCWSEPFLLPGRYLSVGTNDASARRFFVVEPITDRQYRITLTGEHKPLAIELDDQGFTKWIDSSTLPLSPKNPKAKRTSNSKKGLGALLGLRYATGGRTFAPYTGQTLMPMQTVAQPAPQSSTPFQVMNDFQATQAMQMQAMQMQPMRPMEPMTPLMYNVNVNGRSGTIVPQAGGFGANFYGPAFKQF